MSFCMRTTVQIDDDGVETRLTAVYSAAADTVGNVTDLHAYPRIGDSVFSERSQRPPAPFDNGRVEFSHDDRG